MDEFFARNPLQLDDRLDTEDADAALGAVLLRYLRRSFDTRTGAWAVQGRDDRETLRRTCHAAEVLHRLSFDRDTAALVRESGNWLINLPANEHHSPADRHGMRMYPSRFKTLAHLNRFDDPEVRSDFLDLLSKEVNGLIRNAGESDVLTTCIVLDTLLHLDRIGQRAHICADDQYERIVRALRVQLRAWKPPQAQNGASARAPSRCEIDNPRDLSYAFGLLVHVDPAVLPARSLTNLAGALVTAIRDRNRGRASDWSHALYSALQLAEHRAGDMAVRPALADLLAELRALYAAGDAVRHWDMVSHTLVLRLLLTFYGDAEFGRLVASQFLRDVEIRHDEEGGLLEAELQTIVRERLRVQLGDLKELSGGYTEDRVYHVPFLYSSASMIVKRSTRDNFLLATENYKRLPPHLRDLFVRLPSEAQVHKSGKSSSYFLIMEDLTNLETFWQLFNEFDQRAMSDAHRRLLERATALACDAVFSMFRATSSGRSNFPGTQVSRLYLSQIESKLARAVERVPWLKNSLQSYRVGEQRYKALDYYLGVVTKHAHALQPRSLGLAHGDFHARNIMLDRDCTRLKLIDLDKLVRAGDYLGDLGTLLQDLAAYRRIIEPEREYGLPRDRVLFESNPSAKAGTVESAVRYPALGRPATVFLQDQVLRAVEHQAQEIGDVGWKPRIWLATATALLMRLAYQTEKEAVSVIYGEGVRLLHELSRFLEHGEPLPTLLFPQSWPEPTLARLAFQAELPQWAAHSALLREVHTGLEHLAARTEYSYEAVRYYADHAADGPAAAMAVAHRGALARLLLRSDGLTGPLSPGIEIASNGKSTDRLRSVVLIAETASATDVLALAQTAFAPAPANALAPAVSPPTPVADARQRSGALGTSRRR